MKTNEYKVDGLKIGDIVELTKVWEQDQIFFGKELKNGLIGEILKYSHPGEKFTDIYVMFQGRETTVIMKQDQVKLIWRPLARRDFKWLFKNWIIDRIRFW